MDNTKIILLGFIGIIGLIIIFGMLSLVGNEYTKTTSTEGDVNYYTTSNIALSDVLPGLLIAIAFFSFIGYLFLRYSNEKNSNSGTKPPRSLS
jgi:hypothetical protein